MRISHVQAVILIVISALATAGLAAEKMSSKPKLIRLKSNGRTVAEVRLLTRSPMKFEMSPAGRAEVDETTGRFHGRNGVTLRIGEPKQEIEIKADELEIVPERE